MNTEYLSNKDNDPGCNARINSGIRIIVKNTFFHI
jgi:hypothetical protein